MGVPADGDGLGPARDQAGDVFANDGFPEDGPPEDVPNGPVGTLPHLLQLELCEDRVKVAPLQPPPSNQNPNPQQERSQTGALEVGPGLSGIRMCRLWDQISWLLGLTPPPQTVNFMQVA